ncbi:MAG: electron transport complex subunit E [Pseudomonadota bacterium]
MVIEPTKPTSPWRNNIALVQLLGLGPLLAMTTSVVNGVGLGLATCFVLFFTSLLVSAFRKIIPVETRIAVFVVLIASLVTCVELFLLAYFPQLHDRLGIFVPLIVCNCAILGRAEVFAYKNPVLPSALDGLITGIGFALVLLLMGAFREVLGNGTLFADMELLVGDAGRSLLITLSDAGGFRLLLLPPGAFLSFGLLVALHRVVAEHRFDEEGTATKSVVSTESPTP